MAIDEKLIKYLEDLSFVTLSSEERMRIRADLESIIAGMELLSKLDTSSVSDQVLPLNAKTDLRKDEATSSFTRNAILKNAPVSNGETFVIPKAVE